MSDHFAVCDNDQLSAGQIRTPPGVKLSQQGTPMDDSQPRFTPSVFTPSGSHPNTPSLKRTGTINR